MPNQGLIPSLQRKFWDGVGTAGVSPSSFSRIAEFHFFLSPDIHYRDPLQILLFGLCNTLIRLTRTRRATSYPPTGKPSRTRRDQQAQASMGSAAVSATRASLPTSPQTPMHRLLASKSRVMQVQRGNRSAPRASMWTAVAELQGAVWVILETTSRTRLVRGAPGCRRRAIRWACGEDGQCDGMGEG